MKRIPFIAAGMLLVTFSVFGNEEGVRWNAQYNRGNNSVQVVVDTQGLEKTSHLEGVRFRFLVDGGPSKVQLALGAKTVKAGTLIRETISVGSKIHSLTPDMAYYRVAGEEGTQAAPAGQPAVQPHQLAPTADLQ